MADNDLIKILKQQGQTLSLESVPAPSTPLGIQAVGGSADSAKMASFLGKSSVGPRVVAPKDDLATVLRRQQVREKSTSEEEALLALQKEAVAKYGKGGENLASMVDAKINALLRPLDVSPIPGGPVGDATRVSPPSPEISSLDAIITKLSAAPTDKQVLSEAASLLSFNLPETSEDVMQVMEALKAAVPTRAVDLVKIAAESMKPFLKMSAEDFKNLGFAGAEDAAHILDIPLAQLNGMNMDEVVNLASDRLLQESSVVENLQSLVGDPFLGATERAEARRELRASGAVGVRSADTEIDKLAEEMLDKSLIEVDGQKLKIEDALDSEYISGLAVKYFEGDERTKEEFRKNNSSLSKFFDSYQGILQKAVQGLEPGLKDYADVQIYNKGLSSTVTGQKISDDIMRGIYGDKWGRASNEKLDMKASVPLSILRDGVGYSTNEVSSLYSNMNQIFSFSPEFAQELMTSWKEADLHKYGLLNSSSANYTKLVDNLTTWQALKNGRIAVDNPDSLARMIGANSSAELEEMVKKAQGLSRLGVSPPFDLAALSMASLADVVRGASLPTSLRDAASTPVLKVNKNLVAQLQEYLNTKSSSFSGELSTKILQTMGPAGTGRMNVNLAKSFADSLSLEQLGEFISNSSGQLDALVEPVAAKSLEHEYRRRIHESIITPAINLSYEGSPSGGLGAKINWMRQQADRDWRNEDPTVVTKRGMRGGVRTVRPTASSMLSLYNGLIGAATAAQTKLSATIPGLPSNRWAEGLVTDLRNELASVIDKLNNRSSQLTKEKQDAWIAAHQRDKQPRTVGGSVLTGLDETVGKGAKEVVKGVKTILGQTEKPWWE